VTKSDENSSVALLSDGSKDSLTRDVVPPPPTQNEETDHIGPKKEKFL
jgi:hypothetical protein